MEYLFNMGLAGSTMWILYLLIKLFAKDKLCDRYRYVMLKCILVYYLIPIPFMKRLYRFIWKHIAASKDMQQWSVQYKGEYRVLFVENQMYLSQPLRMQLIIGGVWIIIGMTILAYKIKKYLTQRRILLRCRKQGTRNPYGEEDRKSLQAKIGLKSNIVYIDSTVADVKGTTAFTLGLLKPIILYPAKRNPHEIRFILEHELQHIKNKDVFWRLLLDIAGIMHFYNPFEWFFAAEFEIVSEMVCDAQVLQNKGEQQRKAYAELLIQMAQDDTRKVVWSAGMSRKKKKVQERVEHIMKREKKYFGKAVSLLMIGTAVFLSSFTAFAYDDVKVWRDNDIEDTERFFKADVAFVPDGEDGVEIGFYRDTQEYINMDIIYDMQFIDEEGNIFEIEDHARDDALSTNAVCSHQYVSGTVTEHVRDGAGGCTVTHYSAQRCSKCGVIVKGAKINTIIYETCPH